MEAEGQSQGMGQQIWFQQVLLAQYKTPGVIVLTNEIFLH